MRVKTKVILFCLAILVIGVWSNIAKSPADTNQPIAYLYVLDVGQGDSILIEKGSYQILIDGGPDTKILSELGKILPPSDRKIEEVVLTHPHADHITGLNAILDRYEVGEVIGTGVIYDSNALKQYREKLASLGKGEKIPDIGEVEKPFDNGQLTFLWPGNKYQGQTIDNLNNSSIVTRFCYFAHCALLLGDEETDEQALMFDTLARQNISLDSELLKAAHHGSANGTNQMTLDQVKPRYAAISVGAHNTFGHPNPGTLDLLKNANIQTDRTDQGGTIEYVFTESGISKK